MKLKTIRVHATMHTDLYQYINVPATANKDDIWQFIRDGNVPGECLYEEEPSWATGGWDWEEPTYDNPFKPEADDMSKEFINRLDDLITDERGNFIAPCGCIEAKVLDTGHYCKKKDES